MSRIWQPGLALALTLTCAAAQSFKIEAFTTSGGGGTSTNGQFALVGTAGQADAGGVQTGGQFGLQGGFWSVAVAVQTPGAPLLSVVRAGSTLVISWPLAESAGFVLEQASTLPASASWLPAGLTVMDDGLNRSVSMPVLPGRQFFRLRRP